MYKDYITPQMSKFWGRTMKNTQLEQEPEEKEERVVSIKPELKLISGGGDNFEGSWLQGLPKGTWFACKPKLRNNPLGLPHYQLLSLQIIGKTVKTVLLLEKNADKLFGMVDPASFCSDWNLHEILWQPEEGKNWPQDYEKYYLPKEEEEHGNSDRIQGNGPGEGGELDLNDRT